MRKIIFSLLMLFVAGSIARADVSLVPDVEIDSDDFVSISEILDRAPDATECSTTIFANALAANVDKIDADAHNSEVQQWIYQVFAFPDVLTAVLQCPEFNGLADDDTIKFIPIEYTFPNGRRIVTNYETQPKILRQRINIGTKRDITDANPSPRIGDINDPSTWSNTDPAWYAIMVVQSGALDAFVGPNKNNTISMRYINDNIDRLYPTGLTCTSKSALANDNYMINRAVRKTVNMDDDTNDYYVAGDVSLEWISYTEIALDVVVTVATFGGGAVLSGVTKSARAARILKNMKTEIRTLSKLDHVRDYIRATQKYEKLGAELKKVNRLTNYAEYKKISDEMENVAKGLKDMEKVKDAKNAAEVKKVEDLKRFKELDKSYREINEYRHSFRGLRTIKSPQSGNIATRLFRALKAANSGAVKLNKGAKVARSSMKSGKILDWLFHSSMRTAGKLAKAEEIGGLLYGTIKFVGDMYDYTESSTGQFTNNIEFKPLLLLSADDLQGQENVVNYGMWLMWLGDSISAADDDAAYLQAMDFAQKFHQDLTETQDEENRHPCNVDIYVVRPVIRNPDSDNPELYYLIMNDQPWSTEN